MKYRMPSLPKEDSNIDKSVKTTNADHKVKETHLINLRDKVVIGNEDFQDNELTIEQNPDSCVDNNALTILSKEGKLKAMMVADVAHKPVKISFLEEFKNSFLVSIVGAVQCKIENPYKEDL